MLLGRLGGLRLYNSFAFLLKSVTFFKRFLIGFVQNGQQFALKEHVNVVETENAQEHLSAAVKFRHSGNALHQRQSFHANQIALDHHGLDFLQAFLLDPLERPEALHLALEFAVDFINGLELAHDGIEVRIVAHVSRCRSRRRTNDLPLVDQVHISAQR